MMIEIANYIIYYPAQASTYLWGAVIFSFASHYYLTSTAHHIQEHHTEEMIDGKTGDVDQDRDQKPSSIPNRGECGRWRGSGPIGGSDQRGGFSGTSNASASVRINPHSILGIEQRFKIRPASRVRSIRAVGNGDCV